ncbi:hypothetical protein G655_10725 [Pseudomonas aeruginosa B136-33]|nr:hypothetical protein G655_10725 [Pseudomonas aeruginosa B136-33]
MLYTVLLVNVGFDFFHKLSLILGSGLGSAHNRRLDARKVALLVIEEVRWLVLLRLSALKCYLYIKAFSDERIIPIHLPYCLSLQLTHESYSAFRIMHHTLRFSGGLGCFLDGPSFRLCLIEYIKRRTPSSLSNGENVLRINGGHLFFSLIRKVRYGNGRFPEGLAWGLLRLVLLP